MMQKDLTQVSALCLALVGLLLTDLSAAQMPPEQPFRLERITVDTDLKPNGEFVQITEQRVKIQTQAGLQGASQMVFAYNVSMQRFEVLRAYTVKNDGRKIEVAKDKIFIRDLPVSASAPTFADVKAVAVVFPDVAIGDSLVARVRHEQVEPMFPGHYSNLFYITPHTLIDEAYITLRAPAVIPLHIDNEGYTEKRNEHEGFVTYEWTSQNTAVEPIEQGTVAPLDYSRRLSISTFFDFADFAKAYAARADDKAAVKPEIQNLADELTHGVTNEREQAQRLYEWVTQNIRYVAIFLGMGAVVPHRAEDVLANRYGDCKDNVTLFNALLAAKGIEGTTAIVGLGTSFWISNLPLLSNFNHVIAYIPSLDLFLDPTSSTTPFGRLPISLQGKTVVMANGERRKTPRDKGGDNVASRQVKYAIQEDGTVKGLTLIRAKGVRAVDYRALAKVLSAENIPSFVREFTSTTRYKGEGTVEFSGTEERNDSMQVTASYTLSGGIDWPGTGAFEVPSGFRGGEGLSSQLQRNATALKRASYVGTPETLVEEYVIQLPLHMKVVSLPQNVNFSNALATYEAMYRHEGRTIYVTRKLVDLYHAGVLQPLQMPAVEEKSNVIARDLRAQIMYAQE
jgi:transglutaminase-like putative cysteine protease